MQCSCKRAIVMKTLTNKKQLIHDGILTKSCAQSCYICVILFVRRIFTGKDDQHKLPVAGQCQKVLSLFQKQFSRKIYHALMHNNQSTNQRAAQSCSFACTFLCSEEHSTTMADSVSRMVFACGEMYFHGKACSEG